MKMRERDLKKEAIAELRKLGTVRMGGLSRKHIPPQDREA
jgi:hypothetical protein